MREAGRSPIRGSGSSCGGSATNTKSPVEPFPIWMIPATSLAPPRRCAADSRLSPPPHLPSPRLSLSHRSKDTIVSFPTARPSFPFPFKSTPPCPAHYSPIQRPAIYQASDIPRMNEPDIKQRFRDMPEDKRQRLYDSMAKLFAKLEADWKSKPENAGKPISYNQLWEDHLKTMESG